VTWLVEGFGSIRDFFEAGGYVLWGVFAAAVLLWTFIVERLIYFRTDLPRRMDEVREAWAKRTDHTSWYARRIRERMLSEFSMDVNRNVGMVKVCTAVAPLFGLLGTVTGMISVFDVMANLGTGNARAMASGVSMATLPTMAGMVVALSGLYFTASLPKRAKDALEELADELRYY
jgi:biopolymer transport protein ExbB